MVKDNIIHLDQVGLGLMNATQKYKRPPGSAKVSLNFLHSNLEDGQYQQAELRKYVKRAWTTRPANAAVKFLAELRKKDGTRVHLTKINGVIYDWDNEDYETNLTSLGSGYSTTILTDWCQGFDRVYLCDNANKAYSTASGLFDLSTSSRPTTSMTLTETGSATGFGTGTFEYNYTVYSSVEGWESRPRASSNTIVKADANLGVRWSNPSDAALTGIYDRYRLYRRLQGENAWYLIATINPASGFPYTDTTLDANLTDAALAEIYDNETGLEDFTPPSTFSTMAFYRGRVFGAVEDTLYWSKVGLPFLFKTNEIARKRIGDDGDPIIAVRVINESLTIFKRHSIWVMNGDAEEENYIFFPVTRKIGAINKLCVVQCPGGCMFISSDYRVYFFNLNEQSLEKPVSYNQVIDFNRGQSSTWCGGYCPITRHVYFSVTTGSQTSNETTFAISIDGWAWSNIEYKKIFPTYYAEYLDNVSPLANLRLVFGSTNGYAYAVASDTSGDGVNEGLVESTISSVTSQSQFDVSGSPLSTTGDGLARLSVTVKVNDETWETQEITSNDLNTIQCGAFSAILAVGMKVYIGAMTADLEFNDVRPSKEEARVDEIQFSMTPIDEEWLYGIVVDESNTPDYVERDGETGRVYARLPRRGFAFRPKIYNVGTGLTMDLSDVMFSFVPLRGKR